MENFDQLLKEEQKKYLKAYSSESYIYTSPGLVKIWDALPWLNRKPIISILDVGCGEGYVVKVLHKSGYLAYGTDIVDVVRKEIIHNHNFFQIPIWDLRKIGNFDAVVSFDMLEHLPEHIVDLSLENLTTISTFFYFTISCRPDQAGRSIGEDLHLTVKPPSWWIEKLMSNGFKIDGFSGNVNELKIFGATSNKKRR